VLATRVDLLPPEWIAELSELQNAVPALPYADIREQLEADLGAPPQRCSPSSMKPDGRRLAGRPIAHGCMMVARWC
jgi:predicted unusual protein kinase regulating ubiquinone biosynthesis (AarF/ABC1/UbiB family)